MKKRIKIIISGLVHGVNFRHFILENTQDLMITGRVRNSSDGTLEIVAEGEEDALKKLLALSRRGPKLARVDKVTIDWQQHTGEFSDFKISFF